MKRTIGAWLAAMVAVFLMPLLNNPSEVGAEPVTTPLPSPITSQAPWEERIAPVESETPPEEPVSTAAEVDALPVCETPRPAKRPVPQTIRLLAGDEVREVDAEEYIIGVVAAEMPAKFAPEALKAQAVAARSYAIYCTKLHKHENADVCGSSACCQAWISDEEMKEVFGSNLKTSRDKIAQAVQATAGEFLEYEGEAIFAAFHSSSAGATEDCGKLWGELPYLVSVDSPETAADVPDFVSYVQCSPLDFRDTVLYAEPAADFSKPEEEWIGEIQRDDSGRVDYAVLGGVKLSGKELRKLFSLRSAAFELEYSEGRFLFTVSGFGHGVGMSQYGADTMAKMGASYREILSHYYSGAELVK